MRKAKTFREVLLAVFYRLILPIAALLKLLRSLLCARFIVLLSTNTTHYKICNGNRAKYMDG